MNGHNHNFLFPQPQHLNPNALRKAKIVYNFGLSECNRVKNAKTHEYAFILQNWRKYLKI